MVLHQGPMGDAHVEPQYNFTVCLGGPLRYAMSDILGLAEWIEINNMFGADHFILYNHSAKSELDNILHYYEGTRHLVEVLPWQLPPSMLKTTKFVKNFGHIALIHDCLHRSMYKSRYVVYVDLEEIIVPRKSGVNTWSDLLKSSQCQSAEYLFHNVFFKVTLPPDQMMLNNPEVKFKLLTLLKTKREANVWPARDWSKYIVKPEHVLLPGINVAHQLLNNAEPCTVDPKDALLHHYRARPPTGPWIEDRTMHQYRKEFENRIESTLKHV